MTPDELAANIEDLGVTFTYDGAPYTGVVSRVNKGQTFDIGNITYTVECQISVAKTAIASPVIGKKHVVVGTQTVKLLQIDECIKSGGWLLTCGHIHQ